MNPFTYENQGSDKFLIYRLEGKEELDQMALGMLSHNHIPHLLPVSYVQMDAERYLRYSGLSQGTLKSQLSGVMSRERLLQIFCSICEGIQLSEEYLLDGNSFVLDAEFIFVDRTGERTSLIYLPVLGREEKVNYISFFKNIITNVITDPADDGSYITGILNYLNSTENFSLTEFSKLLKELRLRGTRTERTEILRKEPEGKAPVSREKRNREAAPVQKPVQKPAPNSMKDRPAPQPTPPQTPLKSEKQSKKLEKSVAPAQKEKEGYSFEVPGSPSHKPSVPTVEAEVEESGEEAMSVLHLLRNFSGENLKKFKEQKQEQKKETGKEKGEDQKRATGKNRGKKKGPSLQLVSLDPGLPYIFDVKKDSFQIGRRENNDGVLETISSVSRVHCRILREDGAFYVEDLNSKYGTKVDGVSCRLGERSTLNDQSVLELPGISFRVELREK